VATSENDEIERVLAPEESGDHLWLRANGKMAALERKTNYGCFLVGALWLLLFVGIGLAIGSLGKMIWAPVLTALGIWAARKKAEKIFYNEIFCPTCGYNPTLRKSDGERRKDTDKIHAQLRRFTHCPECGDSGKTQSTSAKPR
jgi:hypothetical protein